MFHKAGMRYLPFLKAFKEKKIEFHTGVSYNKRNPRIVDKGLPLEIVINLHKLHLFRIYEAGFLYIYKGKRLYIEGGSDLKHISFLKI